MVNDNYRENLVRISEGNTWADASGPLAEGTGGRVLTHP